MDWNGDGTPENPIQFPFVNYSECVRNLERAIYEFDENNPDFGLHNYGAILEENGIEWGTRSMEHCYLFLNQEPYRGGWSVYRRLRNRREIDG